VFTSLHASEEAMKRRDKSTRVPQKWHYQGMERLQRRAENLKRLLDAAAMNDKEKEMKPKATGEGEGGDEGEGISLLGISLFGLDVLNQEKV